MRRSKWLMGISALAAIVILCSCTVLALVLINWTGENPFSSYPAILFN